MNTEPLRIVAIVVAVQLTIAQPVVLSVILTLTAIAVPQAGSDGPAGQIDPTQQASAKPDALPKTSPPPLFPRHRRGLYLNGLGLEVLDATPQSPPLETDDPGVPERGVYEINLSANADVSRGAGHFDLLFVDANYGVLPSVMGRELPTQLKFEAPISAARDTGSRLTAGLGAAKVGLKFNFYNSERQGVQMSFYPQIAFGVGARTVENDLAEPGQTLIFPLLVSKEFSYVTLVVNGTVNKPLHDPDRHATGAFSAGLGLAVTRKIAAMAELHSETRFDLAHDRLLALNVGVMRSVTHAVVLYANVGHSLFSDDDLQHAYVGVGVKVLIKPGPGKPS